MTGSNGGHPPSVLADLKSNVNLITGVCGFLAAPLMALCARPGTIGERFHGFPMVVGVVLQFLVILFAAGPTGGAEAVLTFGFMCVVLLGHRIHRWRLWRTGYRCHSMYTGSPLVRGAELTAKGVTIPVLALLTGLVAVEFVKGLGTWLIAAAVAQAVTTVAYRTERDARARALRDARLDQEILRRQMEDLQ